ncbi:MAG: DUF4132 domain-containing protein [Capnocytophaga sp.]|nr:DUF4132 domain-containing protein [Capnocytophaga sp.]
MLQDDIDKKMDYEQPRALHGILYDIQDGKTPDLSKLLRFNAFPPEMSGEPQNILGKIFGSKEKTFRLSKKTAELGLLFLNCYPDYADSEYYNCADTVYPGSKRLPVFQQHFDIEHLWDGEHYDLLVLVFGKNDAPLVKKAWEKAPQLMYQKGYYRRSFRRPNDELTGQLLQINFFIELINAYSVHPFTLAECLQYDVALGGCELLVAAALENDPKLYQLACDILQGNAENGHVSRLLIKSLLLTDYQPAWQQVGNLLLAAQRQEGLRQTILESLDETSVGAFQYMLQLINSENLTRFSSVVRAMDVWAGFAWGAEKQSTVKRFAELAEKYVTTPSLLNGMLSSPDNAELYMALWGQGVHDVDVCFPILKTLYEKGNTEKKILVLYFVNQTNITEWKQYFVEKALFDTVPAVHYWGVILLPSRSCFANPAEIIDRLETLYEAFPEKEIITKGKVFSWLQYTYSKKLIASAMLDFADFDDADERIRMLKYYEFLPIENRESLVRKMLRGFLPYSQDKEAVPTVVQRDFALQIISDRSSYIRSAAMNVLKKSEISDSEILIFEEMLKRKSSDFRQFVLETIQKRSVSQIFESAGRLLSSAQAEQRLAGLDLLDFLNQEKENQRQAQAIATDFQENRKLNSKEKILIDKILQSNAPQYDASNGFGLYNPENKTVYGKPEKPTSGVFYENVVNAKNKYGFSISEKELLLKIKKLQDLIWQYRDYEYESENWDGSVEKVLLGNVFMGKERQNDPEKKYSPREIFENHPLPDVWENWYKTSGLTVFDLFLLGLSWNYDFYYSGSADDEKEKLFPKTHAKTKTLFPRVPFPGNENRAVASSTLNIIRLLGDLYPYDKKAEYLLDGWQYAVSQIDERELHKVAEIKSDYYVQTYVVFELSVLSNFYYSCITLHLDDNVEKFTKKWHLWRFTEQNIPADYENSRKISFGEYLKAHKMGLCTDDELMQQFFSDDNVLRILTADSRYKHNKKEQERLFAEYPFLAGWTEKVRNRILEIELKRGDSSTPVTRFAGHLQSVYGIHVLLQILNGLGNDTLNRGYVYAYGERTYSKKEILSKLLKCCYPSTDDTDAVFAEKINEAGITEQRLIEVAMYAPQWLPFVQNYLNWKGLGSAVWWLHAHTNSYHSAETESEIAQFSNISIRQFSDGVVDYHWFQQAYSAIGKQRWKLLYDAAKYISEGTGHSRAKLYADVMTGETKIREVAQRVKEKRNQDYVRVYGLVPLSKTAPQKDVLNRYNYLLEFANESKQFGAQRQASEKLAVEIAMDNLAFTAGYPDPIRLTWAMETEEAKTILANSEVLTFDEYTVELQIDEQGKSEIVTHSNGKKLKSIPPKLNSEKAVVQLKDFHSRLKKQYSRSRKSLEEAMVRGDAFLKDELMLLMSHPVIAPMLKKLVLTDGISSGFFLDGKLVNPNGASAEIKGEIRIAHCCDLYASGQWQAYQHYCFTEKIIQPFKQIFRELYVPTADELEAVTVSKRYAGHQVQPQKTVALLKSRGWKADYEEGLQKVFHKEGFIAKIYAMADWFSPADVESPTLETVEFISRENYKGIPFKEINPLIFSEVMRDLDLVVSVAHVGGVDPEASQSSIELRSAIIRETLQLFKLTNVQLQGHHALINGSRAEYSVHLGSGVTHLRPGKSLYILPVHSQHRGRLFLPFVDEDPKSAEIMSKILMLANDKDLKDPTILEQLK